jgi:ATP-dependent Clp protease adaptor protein ClpS
MANSPPQDPSRLSPALGDEGLGLALAEAPPKLEAPKLYRVLLLNDDYTPMEFVVSILEQCFGMDRARATHVMLEVHTKGRGSCGVYAFQIAETKVAQVMALAREHQHPLMCVLEALD